MTVQIKEEWLENEEEICSRLLDLDILEPERPKEIQRLLCPEKDLTVKRTTDHWLKWDKII